jgi:hypothetical protein
VTPGRSCRGTSKRACSCRLSWTRKGLAATTRWIGDRLDRHYAISVLAQHRNNRPIGPADTIPAAISTGRCVGTCGEESGGPPHRAGRAQAQQLDSVIDIGESVLMSYLGRPAFHSGTLDLLGASARPTDQMVMM